MKIENDTIYFMSLPRFYLLEKCGDKNKHYTTNKRERIRTLLQNQAGLKIYYNHSYRHKRIFHSGTNGHINHTISRNKGMGIFMGKQGIHRG